MSNQNLVRDTTNGVIWSFFSRFAQLIVQFFIITILSRLLCPEDFATIGVLTVFTILSEVIIDSGFSQALIRESEVDKIDLSSVFYFNLLLGVLIYVVLFLCSPYIAIYFRIEELNQISKILFLSIVFNSMSIVPRTILTRSMSFKKIAISSIGALVISAIVGVLAAYLGMGVYALVLQILVNSFTSMLLVYTSAKWMPIWAFSWYRISRLFGFSFNLLISGLIVNFFNNLYTILIGKYYPQKTLGYYTQAKKLEEIPSLSITTIIQNVSYSSMSQVKDDTALLKKAYTRVLFMNMFLVLPIMSLCYISCDSFIPLLLGEKWLPIIPYLRILCIYGALFPLFSVNINILKVKGFGNKVLIQEVVRRSLMIVFILITIKSGIEYMLYGWVVSTVLSILYSFYECGKTISYSLWEQIKDIAPFFLLSISCALITYFFNSFDLNNVIKFSIQVGIYTVLYLGASYIFRIQPFIDIMNIIGNLSLKRLLDSK